MATTLSDAVQNTGQSAAVLLAFLPPADGRQVSEGVALLLKLLADQGRLDTALQAAGYQPSAVAPGGTPPAGRRSFAAAEVDPDAWLAFVHKQRRMNAPIAEAVRAAVHRFFRGQRPGRGAQFPSRFAAVYGCTPERVRQILRELEAEA